jgi:hypothetical protein
MQGGKHKQPLGYSVIETMIFMAVSGLMFIFAAGFISGKQANVEYRQSVNDINTQIRSLVNDVSNGQYDSLGSYQCSANDASGTPSFIPGTAAQGTNGGRTAGTSAGCIFLGKILHFGVNNEPTKYAVYTVAARQTKPNSNDTVKNFVDAQPVVIDNGGTLNLTKINVLQNGLSFTSAWECTASCGSAGAAYTSIGAFGFFGSFGGYSGNSTNNESGSQSIFTSIVPGTNFALGNAGNNEASMVSTLNTKLPSMDTPANNFVTNGRLVLLCFVYSGRKGSVTIGGSSGQSFTTDAQLGQRVNAKC